MIRGFLIVGCTFLTLGCEGDDPSSGRAGASDPDRASPNDGDDASKARDEALSKALSGDFTDPYETKVEGSSVFAGKVVLVVTAPVLSQEDAQRDLTSALQPLVGGDEPRVVFLQDMEQAMLGSMARSAMRSAWSPGDRPMLLLDDAGVVRRAIGLGESETVVLALDGHDLLGRFTVGGVLDDLGPLRGALDL